METLPPVSCRCLAYGRPQVLEEAAGSFPTQDYPGSRNTLPLLPNWYDSSPPPTQYTTSRRFRRGIPTPLPVASTAVSAELNWWRGPTALRAELELFAAEVQS